MIPTVVFVHRACLPGGPYSCKSAEKKWAAHVRCSSGVSELLYVCLSRRDKQNIFAVIGSCSPCLPATLPLALTPCLHRHHHSFDLTTLFVNTTTNSLFLTIVDTVSPSHFEFLVTAIYPSFAETTTKKYIPSYVTIPPSSCLAAVLDVYAV